MRPQDATAKIVECAPLLKPDLMRSRLAEYAKGGLPSGGSDGRGSAEKPLPLMGNTDRSILRARNEYSEWLTDAAVALEKAVRLQRAWTVPRTDDTEKAKQLEDVKAGVPCANVACDRWMTGTQDNRPRHIDGAALCERCYRFERRTKRRWSPALEQAEAS